MNTEIRTSFPSFENELLESIDSKAEVKIFETGEEIVKTGQYFRAILLIVDGLIKVYREDEEGNEYFMYYLGPGQACSLSMIPTGRREKRGEMGKGVKKKHVIAVPPKAMD